MDEPFEYLEDHDKRGGSVSLAVVFSVFLHVLLLGYILVYHNIVPQQPHIPIRYVELVPSAPAQQMQMMPEQQQRQFTEAPGPKLAEPPPNATLWSDANRRASMPKPTGSNPTNRPGMSDQLAYVPSMGGGTPGRPAQQRAEKIAEEASMEQASDARPAGGRVLAGAASTSPVDWKTAIRQEGEAAASRGGSGGIGGFAGVAGGDTGTADTGPLSFETSWYDWGEYAQGMVAKIRVNWYSIMPEVIKMGVKGVVTIRFTINRDGHISDITLVKGCGVPPFDYAAQKAIEMSSPLARLPKDFPNDTERVTAMFYYNTPISSRR